MDMWQLLFIAGMVAVLIAAFFVYGPSRTTAGLTAISVIIAVINFLLGPEPAYSEGKNWLQLQLKNLLQVTSFLKFGTLLVWLVFFFVVAHGIYDFWRRRKDVLRVVYFRLNDVAIDQLVRGEIDTKWEKALAGNPPVITNKVFHELKTLLDSNSLPIPEDYYISKHGSDFSLAYNSLTASRRNKDFFIAVAPVPITLSFQDSNSLQAFRSLISPLRNWLISPGFEISLSSGGTDMQYENIFVGSLQKFADKRDILQIFSQAETSDTTQYLNYILYITRDSFPHDFCLFNLYLSNGAGCSPPFGWALEILPRNICLWVAVLENTSNANIQLGNFFFKENQATYLRSIQDDLHALKRQKSINQDWFPPKILKPYEKIVIPMRITFERSEEWQRIIEERTKSEKLSQLISRLTERDEAIIPFPLCEERPLGEFFHVKSAKLLDGLKKAIDLTDIEETYVYGPSISIDGVKVDAIKHPFREFDRKNLFLAAGYVSASCPVLYTFSLGEDQWITEGEVLYGINSKSREVTEQKLLNRFDGRVLIKEHHAETSYINFLKIMIISSNGNKKFICPKNKELRTLDGKYVILRRGEQIEVSFEQQNSLPDDKIYLFIRGYYTISG